MMRKLLSILLLVALAMAVEVDPDTGCEIYSDYLLCPQGADVTGAVVRFTDDTLCPSVINEFGNMEELVCAGDVVLERDLVYRDCKLYVPFDSDDIKLGEMDYERGCVNRTWRRGDAVTIITFRETLGECVKSESGAFYEAYECKTNGQRYVVDGSVSGDGQNRSLLAYTMERQEMPIVDDTALVIIVIVAAGVFFFVLSKWGKEK